MAKQLAPKLDSGYGWLVTFACFLVSFIMQGLARAAGVLYVAIIETYGVSREAATTPFSLRYGVRNMVGPVVGIIAQRFGMRSAVVAGGIFASIGGALCSIAPDVLWITIFWGIVHGIGYGLCCTIHILILNQYFDKYKATSIALALTGDCFGTFVFPTLLEFLLFNYGVDGTFLILGAIALNVVPAGMLMRAPDWSECLKGKTKKNTISETISNHYTEENKNKPFEDNDICISNLYFKELKKIAAPKARYNSLISNFKISSVRGNYFNNVLSSFDSKNVSVFDAEKQKEIPKEILSSENSGALKESLTSLKNGTSRRRLASIFQQSSTIENEYIAILDKERVEKEKCSFEEPIFPDQIDVTENSVCNTSHTEEEIGPSQNNDYVLDSEINKKEREEVNQSKEIILQPLTVHLENCLTSDEPLALTKRKDSIIDKILSLPAAVINEIKDYKPLHESQLNQNNSTLNNTVSDKTREEDNSLHIGNLTFPMRKHSLIKINTPETKCRRILNNAAAEVPIEESQLFQNAIISINHDDCQVGVISKESASALKQFLKLNIRPLMLLIGINLAAYSLTVIAVFTIIADYASDKGLEMDVSKYLIISFSVADLFGRIGFGVVLDKRWIKLSLYSGVNMALMGISVLIIPLSSNYLYMMSCMAVFGLIQGGNAIVYPLLAEEYTNEGEENVALGCLNLYGGLVMLPLAPMIGFFRDIIGNYDGVFYTMGGICLLAGILWILEPLMLNLQQRMSKKAVK